MVGMLLVVGDGGGVEAFGGLEFGVRGIAQEHPFVEGADACGGGGGCRDRLLCKHPCGFELGFVVEEGERLKGVLVRVVRTSQTRR